MLNIGVPTMKKAALPLVMALGLYAASAKAARPEGDNTPKTEVKGSTDLNNLYYDTTNVDTNKFEKLISEIQPHVAYYNNLPVEERAEIRKDARNVVSGKVINLMIDLAENDVLDKDAVKKVLDIIKYPQGLKPLVPEENTEIQIDLNKLIDSDITGETAKENIIDTQEDNVKKLLSEEDEIIMNAIAHAVEKEIESIYDYGSFVQGCFNKYYDTPMGLKIKVSPEEIDKFLTDATGKNLEAIAEDIVQASAEERIQKINDLSKTINNKTNSEMERVKSNGKDRFKDLLLRIESTFSAIENMEKTPEGITLNDPAKIFGENIDIVTAREFTKSAYDAYDKATDIEQIKEKEQRKPGIYRDSKPFYVNVNGHRAIIQKITTVNQDGSESYRYYNMQGIEVNPSDIK